MVLAGRAGTLLERKVSSRNGIYRLSSRKEIIVSISQRHNNHMAAGASRTIGLEGKMEGLRYLEVYWGGQ